MNTFVPCKDKEHALLMAENGLLWIKRRETYAHVGRDDAWMVFVYYGQWQPEDFCVLVEQDTDD